jgi:hypothetical protein
VEEGIARRRTQHRNRRLPESTVYDLSTVRQQTKSPSRDSGDQPEHADIVVFCDESGAKGYADQVEKEPGEIGIFAGFPVQRENLGLLAAEFKNELAELRESTGKIHIAEVSPERQERLRQKVYTVLLRRPIFCFYEAIHVQGFHSAYKSQCELVESIAANLGKHEKRSRYRNHCTSICLRDSMAGF